MSSELKFSWPEKTAPGNEKFYPLPVPGEIARIVTVDGSGRDAGGCIAPSVAGILVILRDDRTYEIRDFSFDSHREWDSNSVWLERWGEIGSARLSDSIPVFVWRDCKSAYHFDSDEARARVEVVCDPTSEWLVAEMTAIGEELSLAQAEEILRQREKIFYEAISEENLLCKSLRGIWIERSRMDIRALAFRWLIGRQFDKEVELRFFADSHPPRWEVCGSREELHFQGEVLLEVPIGARAKWGWKNWKK